MPTQKELEQGYTDTGFIPEDGTSVFKKEKKHSYMPEEINDDVGFLDRGNYQDRM